MYRIKFSAIKLIYTAGLSRGRLLKILSRRAAIGRCLIGFLNVSEQRSLSARTCYYNSKRGPNNDKKKRRKKTREERLMGPEILIGSGGNDVGRVPSGVRAIIPTRLDVFTQHSLLRLPKFLGQIYFLFTLGNPS